MRIPNDTTKLRMLVGADAPTAYRQLIMAHAGVSGVTLCRYKTPPLLQERIEITQAEQQLINKAMGIREYAQIPFWEALFSACLQAESYSDSLFDAAAFHNGPGELTVISAQDVRLNGLLDVVASGERNVGLTSRIELRDAETHHLALMDFHCGIKRQNTEIVAAVCRRLMPFGFLLLDSGDSYHACGFGLMTEDERYQFLGKSLFFAPIVDSAYVAHQLLQPMSSIRISTGGSRSKCPEVLVAELND